jgi:hypothetical protein
MCFFGGIGKDGRGVVGELKSKAASGQAPLSSLKPPWTPGKCHIFA